MGESKQQSRKEVRLDQLAQKYASEQAPKQGRYARLHAEEEKREAHEDLWERVWKLEYHMDKLQKRVDQLEGRDKPKPGRRADSGPDV